MRFRLDGDFAGIGELNCITDEIDQDLRQAASVATAWRQLRSDLDFEAELLIGSQRLQRAAHSLSNILDAVVGVSDAGRGPISGAVERLLALRLRALAILLPAVARRFMWTRPIGERPILGAQRSLWVIDLCPAPMSALGQKQT